MRLLSLIIACMLISPSVFSEEIKTSEDAQKFIERWKESQWQIFVPKNPKSLSEEVPEHSIPTTPTPSLPVGKTRGIYADQNESQQRRIWEHNQHIQVPKIKK